MNADLGGPGEAGNGSTPQDAAQVSVERPFVVDGVCVPDLFSSPFEPVSPGNVDGFDATEHGDHLVGGATAYERYAEVEAERVPVVEPEVVVSSCQHFMIMPDLIRVAGDTLDRAASSCAVLVALRIDELALRVRGAASRVWWQ